MTFQRHKSDMLATENASQSAGMFINVFLYCALAYYGYSVVSAVGQYVSEDRQNYEYQLQGLIAPASAVWAYICEVVAGFYGPTLGYQAIVSTIIVIYFAACLVRGLPAAVVALLLFSPAVLYSAAVWSRQGFATAIVCLSAAILFHARGRLKANWRHILLLGAVCFAALIHTALLAAGLVLIATLVTNTNDEHQRRRAIRTKRDNKGAVLSNLVKPQALIAVAASAILASALGVNLGLDLGASGYTSDSGVQGVSGSALLLLGIMVLFQFLGARKLPPREMVAIQSALVLGVLGYTQTNSGIRLLMAASMFLPFMFSKRAALLTVIFPWGLFLANYMTSGLGLDQYINIIIGGSF